MDVLNALMLFNTRYTDTAVNQLRADRFDVRDEDVARLSPFVRHHVTLPGRYSLQLPELPGRLRPLRDPDAAEEAGPRCGDRHRRGWDTGGRHTGRVWRPWWHRLVVRVS
nr:transposase [Streptomyces rimosus]